VVNKQTDLINRWR